MDLGAILLLLAGVIGGIAGVVQIIDYVQKRIERRREAGKTPEPALQQRPAPDILQNLPPRSEFVGRTDEKEKVHAGLRSRSYLICIVGIGGIGKTSLALEVAHECLHASRSHEAGQTEPFHGFVWIPCQTMGLDLDHLLSQIATALDYPIIADSGLEEKKAAIQRLLGRGRYLLILDNFESVRDDQIAAFLSNLPEPSKALITSREHMLTPAWLLSLQGLSEEESLALMRLEGKRLNLASIEHADSSALLPLFKATGGIPLAIKWCIGQIKQKGQSLDDVLGTLHRAQGDIFDYIFASSWGLLTPSAQNVLFALSVLPSAALKQTIEAGADVHHFYLDEALAQLVEMSLIDASDELDATKRRFGIHPITRAFASSKLTAIPQGHDSFPRRILGHYCDSVPQKVSLGWPGWQEVVDDIENMLYAIRWGYTADWERAKELALTIKWPLWEFGYWQESSSLYSAGFARARELQDLLFMGRYAQETARVCCRQGRLEDAVLWLNQAKQCWSSITVPTLDSADLNGLAGLIEKARGNLGAAKPLLEESLKAFFAEGHDRVEMLRTSTYLGELERDLGNLDAARDWFRRTLEMARSLNQQAAVAWTLGDLGEIEYIAGNYALAEPLLKQGLDAALEISRYHTIADCAFRLGNIRQAQQESQEALTYYHLALDKYRRLGIEKRITEVEEAIQSLEQKFTATAGRTLLARGARLPDTVSSYWRDARIWDRWEVEFSEANKNEHVRQRELTVDAVKRLGAPQVRVMDLCCGTGRVTHDLLSLPNVTEVVAADISDKALDLLTARLHDHPAIGKLRYLRADMMAGSEIYELGRFDIVVCLDSLHHLWDLPTALSRIGELLNDQGMLIANFLVAERVPRHVVAKKGWGRYLRGHILARLFVFLGFIKGVWRFSGRKGIVRFSMLSRPALLPIIRERFRIIESADSDYYWFVATPR